MESLHSNDIWMLVGGVLLIAGILSSMVATRFGAPLLLVFLVIGMLAGEDGPGGIVFSNYRITYALGSVALAIILFDGGLRTRLSQVRGALAPAGALATVGVLLTAGLTGAAARFILGIDWLPALLIGAIVASTDAAAVFFLLRSNGLHLQRRVGATLEVESGSNDPMAIFLTLLLAGLVMSPTDLSAGSLTLNLLQQIGVGGLAGYAGGRALAAALNRLDLPSGLHPLLAVSGAIALVPLTNLLGGSGFLAVYIAGLVVGNRPVRAFANVLSVQDAATWLAQMLMFLVLGLLVTPSRLLDLALPSLAIAAFLMLVARPLAVSLCLWPFKFPRREIAFVSWVGLRGAVSILLSIVPILGGVPAGQEIFNIAFIVVIVSLILQGWSIRPVAEWLNLIVPPRHGPVERIELELPGRGDHEIVAYTVHPQSPVANGERIPRWARPSLVVRDGRSLRAHNYGKPQPGDTVYILTTPDYIELLDHLFAAPAEGASDPALYGEFAIDSEASLADLARMYGAVIPEDARDLTVRQFMRRELAGDIEQGDRASLGPVDVIVREISDTHEIEEIGLAVDPAKPEKPQISILRRSRALVGRFRRKKKAGAPSDPTQIID